MNILELERKYGKYAIKNLSKIIIGFYVLGYILQIAAEPALELLLLDPYCVLHGQIWRLFTWLLTPPSGLSIFTLINLFFFYSLGSTLEKLWGDFKYNLYIFIGIISVVVGVFALYFIGAYTGIFGLTPDIYAQYSSIISYYAGTYYINLSVIIAFCLTIPDMTVMLYFIIPLKMKYFAILEAVFLAIDFFGYLKLGRFALVPCGMMLISLLNLFIFFFTSGKKQRPRYNDSFGTKRANFTVFRGENSGNNNPVGITRHKCVICGRTEQSNPGLTFRFCSKCKGNYEYCEDHLYTHTHIQ